MGGNVKVESEGQGKGSTFCIQLSLTSKVKLSDMPKDF
jgi:signal transduction histidine kinase